MSRGRGENTDTVQTELDDLQRKYRMMEVNRKTYSEDSQNTIRMQRQQITKLKKDNERLKEDLALETRQAKQANNMSASAQIAKLQDQADMYTRKIEVEKRRIEELDKQIKKMQGTILVQRKEMGGINASRENNQQVQKQIRILENRLDKALVKFNEALAHNKQLRETIDNLRRERVVFDGIYRKLERELHEKKNKMAQIIEISNAAYEARDKAQAEMVALKQQADKEQTKFEVEWSQLGQLIEKDRKMKDFIKSKERERSSNKSGDPALEEEQKLRKRVTKGAWGIAKDKANIHLSMEKVQSYEEAFAKIQKATKITDIDELVQTFIHAEDTNFSLFNYVTTSQTKSKSWKKRFREPRAKSTSIRARV
jgi:chromosome segregation ATPase